MRVSQQTGRIQSAIQASVKATKEHHGTIGG